MSSEGVKHSNAISCSISKAVQVHCGRVCLKWKMIQSSSRAMTNQEFFPKAIIHYPSQLNEELFANADHLLSSILLSDLPCSHVSVGVSIQFLYTCNPTLWGSAGHGYVILYSSLLLRNGTAHTMSNYLCYKLCLFPFQGLIYLSLYATLAFELRKFALRLDSTITKSLAKSLRARIKCTFVEFIGIKVNE